MTRPQCGFGLSVILLCWYGMMVIHEFGHMVAAWGTGGSVVRVILHPFALSRTDVAPNPEPLLVVWAGPVIGCALPLVAWLWVRFVGWRSIGSRGILLVRFFAGFCLVANGASLGGGAWGGIGDAGEMQRLGSPTWALLAFGAVAEPLGFLLWPEAGPAFGRGREPLPVTRFLATIAASILLTLVVAGAVFSARA
ncbi:MAG: hypothetical protein AB8G96_09940 [Phycisphaerales bacterium]